MIRLLGTWRSPRNRSPQFPFLHPPNRAQASHKNLYMKNHYTGPTPAEARRNDIVDQTVAVSRRCMTLRGRVPHSFSEV